MGKMKKNIYIYHAYIICFKQHIITLKTISFILQKIWNNKKTVLYNFSRVITNVALTMLKEFYINMDIIPYTYCIFNLTL